MISLYGDAAAKSGAAFIGQGISDGSGVGNVAIWNPWGSGKILLLDKITLASSYTGIHVGADLRSIRALSGFAAFPDHWRNASGFDAPAPAAAIYVMSGTAPNDYPFNRPHHEYWLDGALQDEAYALPFPLVIQQGRGEAACLASVAQCIATFAWREETDPLGQVWPFGGLAGTLIGDMTNLDRARDGVETSYATSTGDTTAITFGIDLGSGNSSVVTRILAKSPPARSFCGATPPRSINWAYATSPDGSAWTTQQTGSITDAAETAQKVADLAVSGTAARMHRMTFSTAAIAGWRIAEYEMHA